MAKVSSLVTAAYWGRDGPVILLADPASPGNLVRVPLTGSFEWRIGADRKCVGRILDGIHVPCPDQAPVTQWSQCPRCSPLASPECVFEPKCKIDPSTCTCPFGPIPHVVYVAFHGPLAKIGMTQERRVERRLCEQGADAWFVVARAPDRATARDTERRISRLYKIPEYRAHREVLPQLARPVDWARIERRALDLQGRLAPRFPVEREVHQLSSYPLEQPVGGVPRRRYAVGHHAGTWLGAKGPHLIYRSRPSPETLEVGIGPALVALKLGDLAGRTLELHE